MHKIKIPLKIKSLAEKSVGLFILAKNFKKSNSMKKTLFAIFLLLPFFSSAQQELDTLITSGHNFIEVLISGATVSFKRKTLKVFYKCKTAGGFVLNEEDEKYKFESYAEILDYFEQRGWDFFMNYPEYVPENIRTVWIMRRR